MSTTNEAEAKALEKVADILHQMHKNAPKREQDASGEFLPKTAEYEDFQRNWKNFFLLECKKIGELETIKKHMGGLLRIGHANGLTMNNNTTNLPEFAHPWPMTKAIELYQRELLGVAGINF